MTAAFTTGFGLGFLVAAQVGPVWLLCARSVLRGRIATGLAIGAAAALVDTAYAAHCQRMQQAHLPELSLSGVGA